MESIVSFLGQVYHSFDVEEYEGQGKARNGER